MNNVEIILRERGKIVGRRESHNIWLTPGSTWLSQLISYATFGPDVWANDNRLRYMGFGIGGHLQTNVQAFIPPLSTAYPGTNDQTNFNRELEQLERPVLYSGADYYKQFDAVDLITPYHLRFTVNLAAADINLSGTYLSVPLSEVGLFINGIDTTNPAEQAMGYDVYDPIPKSSIQDMLIRWTVRL